MTAAPGGTRGPREFLPARRIPLLYLGFAHFCLAAACGLAAAAPASVAGFFYQPRTFAAVHLVTLGWITGSVLGSLYLVGPLAFRLALPERRTDTLAFWCFAIGVLGMVSHFWIDRPLGMVWAAPLPLLAIAHVAARVLSGLPAAPLPAAVKLHVGLSLVFLLLAGGLGLFLGLNKLYGMLPLPPFAGVVAHAHLAGVGFAATMVMGAGYRLLPMFLPAAMPRGPWAFATAGLTSAGVLGLSLEALLRGASRRLWPGLTALGLLLFLGRVLWMLRHPRPAPAELARPDWGMAHALSALAWLVVAIGLGSFVAVGEASEASLRWAKLYGFVALVGFLGQIVVGVEARLLPMAAWLWSFADGGYRDLPASLHRTPLRGLQAAGFLLWTAGVPLLAYAFWHDDPRLISTGAALLLVAVLGNAVNAVAVLRRSRARQPPPGSTPRGGEPPFARDARARPQEER